MRGQGARPGAGPVLAVLAALLMALSGCRDGADPDRTAPNAATAPVAIATGGEPVPDADLAAIRATLDAVNATAGGPVAAQQAELLARTDPDLRSEVQRCPAATTTVRFEPVERALRAAATAGPASNGSNGSNGAEGSIGAGRSTGADGPTVTEGPTGTDGSTGADGANAHAGSGGTAYQWPALIRIFTGDRVVGTDLTTLQMIVRSSGTEAEAYLTPFCVH